MKGAAKAAVVVLALAGPVVASAEPAPLVEIGGRRELFLDRLLVEHAEGVEFRLQHPTPCEVVLTCDEPWEGNGSAYFTVFRDGDLTPPLTFRGDRLSLNFATSAAGGIRVEVQDSDRQPIPGFALADCQDVFGDQLDRAVEWGANADVGALQGRAVRLRFTLRDADLFSFQFQPGRP